MAGRDTEIPSENGSFASGPSGLHRVTATGRPTGGFPVSQRPPRPVTVDPATCY